jgi:hypothetical protein
MATTLSPDHTSGVLAHAMRTLAAHMIDEDLPAPVAIHIDRAASAVVVQLMDDDTPQWVSSIHIDTVREESHQLRDRVATHTIAEGRLPLGVRISLLTITFAPRLTSVPA